MKEYALYKGEECLAIGTLLQISIKMKIKYKTIKFYKTPAYKRRCKNSFNRRTLVEI